MRAATEGSLPPVMPQGNLVEVLGREVRQGSPGELMVESTPSRQRRPPCKTNKEMTDEAADAAALTYLLTRHPWGRFIPGCPPPYDHLNCGSPEHAGLREQGHFTFGLTVEALYLQPPLFSKLSRAVSTVVLTTRPNQCILGQVQDSGRAPPSLIVLTCFPNRDQFSKHLHIAAFGV